MTAMDEYFLQYLWRFQKFNTTQLQLTNGDKLLVHDAGFQNHDSGPDFKEAKIKIDDLIWSGSVEIHYKSSDWLQHQHQNDRAYDNVILHVVWKHDQEISVHEKPLPTLVMKDYVLENMELAYKHYMNQPEVIRCQEQLLSVSRLQIISMLDKALTDRLKEKSSQVLEILQSSNNDWEETAYQVLAKNFGFKVNQEAFIRLAASLPYRILRKYQADAHAIEALVFGMAGFLEDAKDDHSQQLCHEFDYLMNKHQLQPSLKRHHWKHSRMRPANFPAVRLAQLVGVYSSESQLFSQLITVRSIEDCQKLVKHQLPTYWMNHYDFGKKTNKPYLLGKSAVENIIINSITPLLAAYSKYLDEVKYLETAQELLESLPAENNHIINKWKAVAINPANSAESQALIHQYNHLCKQKKCLQCNLGISILSPKLEP